MEKNKRVNKEKIKSFERIVVIGASAGGNSAIAELLSQLPADFRAPILVVKHISADATGEVLMDAINASSALKCSHAVHGKKARAGRVYLAPSDEHLLISSDGRLMVTKGAQENRYRPAIDPLFRSTAVAYGNAAIGVVLTGYLDDGTAGLVAMQRCGGICMVQDPKDAEYPDMPSNALAQLKPDHVLPLSQLGAALLEAVMAKMPKKIRVPRDLAREAVIAERVLSDVPSVEALGNQVPLSCPGCGGPLWQLGKGSQKRYRCHVGHSYTAGALIAEQAKKLEETMWTALRMFEERRNLLTSYAREYSGASARDATERAADSQVHIDRIRDILKAKKNSGPGDVPH